MLLVCKRWNDFVSVSMNGWRKRERKRNKQATKKKASNELRSFFHHRVYFIFDFRYDHSHSMLSVLFL